MLQHLFVWIIIFIFSMIGGIIVESLGAYKHNDSFLFVVVSGFCLTVVYAQIYNIFFPIKSCIALLVLLVIYLILGFLLKKKIKEYLEYVDIKKRIKESFKNKNAILLIVFIVVVGILLLIKATQMPFDDDDYLYHCQAVKWIESFRLVKGAGLINSRYGFNPTTFLAYALFGFADIFGETVHTVSAYVGFIIAVGLMIQVLNKKDKYAVCGLGVELYYLTCLNQSISSLNTDLIPNLLVCAVITMWLEYRNTNNYANLSMIIVLIVTMKLSYAFIGLLVIIPIYEFTKNKNYKSILVYIAIALLIAGPYLFRNYYISGWLLYPLTPIDIFDVPWKLPYKETVGQANWIYAWARIPGKEGMDLVGTPLTEWIPIWWNRAATIYVKITIIALLITFIIYITVCIIKLIKKKQIDLILFFTLCILFVEYVYWQITAPDLRFIFINIYLLVVLVIASVPFVNNIIDSFLSKKLITVFVAIVLGFFAVRINFIRNEFLLLNQHSYDRYVFELNPYQISENIVMYYSEESYLPGSKYFPAGEYKSYLERIIPLGDIIEDGFILK